MAKNLPTSLPLVKRGDSVYRRGDYKKPVEITEEERVAIALLDRCEELLREYSETVAASAPDAKRLVSLDIWENHFAVTIAQYHEDKNLETEQLAHVWKKPKEKELVVFRV